MQLRADEAAVVEKAVRLAIESVMNVLCAVNSARTHELQRLVSDRERQIQRLEERVREAETELRLLLRPRTPNCVPGSAPESVTEPRSRAEPEPRDVTVSLLSDPPSDLPDPSDQSCSVRDQSCSVRDQVQSQLQESHCELSCPREEPTRDSTRVKQERLCPSPGRVKAEPVSPERAPLLQDTMVEASGVFHQRNVSEDVSHRLQGLGQSEQWLSGSSPVEEAAVPHSLSVCGPHSTVPHSVPWRTKPSASRRDQSDEAMRRRRASWRAASRRYYARKMARLQIQSDGPRYHPSSSGPALAGSGPAPSGSGPAPWRYSVCDLSSLQHQAPPSSTDLTFMTESDLLSGSFSLNEHL